jgi:hypothetical protein
MWMTWVFAIFTAYLLWESLSLSDAASLIPRLVLSLTLVLLVIELALRIKTRNRGHAEAAGECDTRARPVSAPGSAPLSTLGPQSQYWQALVWIMVLTTSIGLLGLKAGAFLFCIFFMRWFSRESWFFSIVFSVGLGVLLHLLFTTVLQSGWSGWLVQSGLVNRLVSNM